MACLYTLEANNRCELRRILRTITLAPLSYSSCYQLADKFYLLVLSDSQLTRLADGVREYQRQSGASDAKALMWAWAKSELEQNLTWLHYESEAVLGNNGCYLMYGNTKIVRSFLPLTETMLIINQTPDSFSNDGKLYLEVEETIVQVKQALDDGVSIIDVGAESTTPGATLITLADEIKRLEPLILALSRLKSVYNFKLSLDSYRPETINHFLQFIDIVNDVSGNLPNKLLKKICVANKIYLFMHSLTIPANPKVTIPADIDPVTELVSWGQAKLAQLVALGFSREQLICDPGIGFNKTTMQSWYLVRHIARLKQLGVPLLVGHSRKRFLGKITPREFADRDLETVAVSNYLVKEGVDYLRLHQYRDYYRVITTTNQLQPAVG